MGKAITFGEIDDAVAALRRLAAGRGPEQGRARRDHDAQRAAVSGRASRRCCAPAASSSTSIRSTRRASSSTSSRIRAPRRSIILENFATTLEQALARHADQARRRRLRWATCSASPRALIVNFVVRKVKKMVPAVVAAGRTSRFNDAIAAGPAMTFKPAASSARTTSPCCSTPAARPASPRARCCCTATSSPTCCSPRPGCSRR